SPLTAEFIPRSSPSPEAVGSLDGLREHNDWRRASTSKTKPVAHSRLDDTIEEDLLRDLDRLANLAEDDFKRDPSKPAAEHYRIRIDTLFNNPSCKYKWGYIPPMVPANAERGSPPRSTNTVPMSEFKRLQNKVDTLTRIVNELVQTRKKSDIDLAPITTEIAMLEEASKETKPSTAGPSGSAS
ncbi:hypothetical protein LTS18_010152, partial [Coniosporium uncinatum]